MKKRLSQFAVLLVMLLFLSASRPPQTVLAQPDNSGSIPYLTQTEGWDIVCHALVDWGNQDEGQLPVIIDTHLQTIDFTLTYDTEASTFSGTLMAEGRTESDEAGPQVSFSACQVNGVIDNGILTWHDDLGVWELRGVIDLDIAMQARDLLVIVESGGEKTYNYGEGSIGSHVQAAFTAATGDIEDEADYDNTVWEGMRFEFEGDNVANTASSDLISYLWVAGWSNSLPEIPNGRDTVVTEEPLEAEQPTEQPVSTVDQTSSEGDRADLTSALVELLIFSGTGELESWEGWEDLTETQRQALVALIERLEERAEEYAPPEPGAQQEPVTTTEETKDDYITPYQQNLLDEHERQELAEERRQEAVQEAMQDELRAWQRIQEEVTRAYAADRLGEWAAWLYDNYRASGLPRELINRAGEWLEIITDPEEAAQNWLTDKIKEEAANQTGNITEHSMTVEQMAVEGLRTAMHIATVPSVVHYGYYRVAFDENIKTMDREAAHAAAMDALRDAIDDPPDDLMEADGGRLAQCWTDSWKDQAKDGGIYDQAFQRLDTVPLPGVTK